jgi:hypothetical protein
MRVLAGKVDHCLGAQGIALSYLHSTRQAHLNN